MKKFTLYSFFTILIMSMIVGCGGGSSSTDTTDTTKPVITLQGANPATATLGSTYSDAGATATDNVDGTVDVVTSGVVDTSVVGVNTITYTATDKAGNTATATRTVNVSAEEQVVAKVTNFADPQVIADLNIKSVGLDTTDGTLKLPSATEKMLSTKGETTFPYIWIANSDEGTISKLDVKTGDELARYRTGPGVGEMNSGTNPSRTTVDQDGNVWVGNRNGNTITKVGLKEWDQCIDRNGNGVIDTSIGGDDVKDWTGYLGDGNGSLGATDECILHHIAMEADGIATPTDIRTVAITPNNNVFVGGYYTTSLFKVDNQTGKIIHAVDTKQSHYGGVVDKFGNLWSMSSGSGKVQKTSNDMNTTELIDLGHSGYGITIDKYGKVWTTEYGQRFSAFDPSDPVGTLQVFDQNNSYGAQGIASDGKGDIFIAGSLSGTTVGHYRQNFNSDGNFTGVTFVANYTVESGPTGVAVDGSGLVWATNYYSDSVSRINPVDANITTYPVGQGPYNYSDMTGNVVRNVTKRQGTWEATYDSEEPDFNWTKASWKLKVALPAGTNVRAFVKVANSEIALNAEVYVEVFNGVVFSNMEGQYLKMKVELSSDDLVLTPEVIEISIK